MAKATRSKHYETVTAILRERNIAFRLEHGGKHPKIAFVVGGRRILFAIPSTPGDCRGHLRAATYVRRAIREAEGKVA